MSSLFEQVITSDNLYSAWQLVKAKGSAGGIDNVNIDMFNIHAAQHLELLQKQLLTEKYIPEPYKSFSIPKDENEFRKLGLPTIKDKIVQSATRTIIEPLFEQQFLNISYGYRSGKGAVKAIHRVQHRMLGEHFEWITLADIDNFFDTIKPEIVYGLLDKTLQCPGLMRLIKLWVQIGSVNFKQKYSPYSEGIPQGSVLSPLFSNVYLHPFDTFLVEKGYAPVRYADDFVIFSNNEKQAKNAYYDARNFLEKTLQLKLNREWKIKKAEKGFEFLHIHFIEGQISLTPDRVQHLYEKIDKAAHFNNAEPDSLRIIQTMKGISNYYGKLVPQHILEQIDNHFQQTLAHEFNLALNNRKIKTLQAVEDFINQLPFLSKLNEGNRKLTIRTIIEKIKSARSEAKAIKISTETNKIGITAKGNTSNKTDNRDRTHDEKEINRAIEKKRLQYEQLADANRELLITSPGVFIGKTQKGVVIKENGKIKSTVPIHNLQHITILNEGVSLSGNLIHYCATNQIPIDFIGFDGLPYAKFYTPHYTDANIGNAQLKAIENGLGISLIKLMVCGKLKNQLHLIKYYHKYRKNTDDDYTEAYSRHTKTIESSIEKIKLLSEGGLEKIRGSIMGYEGTSATAYWDMMVRLLNNYTFFEGRERQGATDLVNCLLNYGYGILYSRIWQAIIHQRLNPHISYLHAITWNKPTLAFDLIEEFRQQAVDKVVFALISKGEEVNVNNGLLDPETKKRLIEKVLERLNNKENFRGSEHRLGEIIQIQAHAVTQHLQGVKTYKPYVAKW